MLVLRLFGDTCASIEYPWLRGIVEREGDEEFRVRKYRGSPGLEMTP